MCPKSPAGAADALVGSAANPTAGAAGQSKIGPCVRVRLIS